MGLIIKLKSNSPTSDILAWCSQNWQPNDFDWLHWWDREYGVLCIWLSKKNQALLFLLTWAEWVDEQILL